MTDPIDADARRRIAEHLDTTLFVEAAAGTGKTTALVGRIVALLRSGRTSLRGVVALTFADKAAGEMRLRLRTELELARAGTGAGSAERRRLDDALEQLELARIATIHAFCGDLLQERPVEAGVDPLFAIAPPDEAARLLERAFDDWFQSALAAPPEGVRRLLRRRPRGPDARGARETLLGAARSLVEHRDYAARWRRDPFDRERAIDAVMTDLDALAALAPRASYPEDWLAQNLSSVARFANENRLREAVRGRDYDALEAELRELARNRKTGWHYRGANKSEFCPGVPRTTALAQRDAAKARLEQLVADCDADLAACLQPELLPVVRKYEEHKRAAGVLDFVDLLVCTRDLLVRDAAVREDLARRFTHYFVDEFQDTDPLQAEILMLLVSRDPAERDWRAAVPAPGRLFLVGDPKQSIYRFRRADVAIYEQIKERLVAHGAELVLLRASFRSVPAIQAAVNAAFEPEMQAAADRSQALYVALEAVRADVPAQPAVVVVPAPRPYGDYGTVVRWKIEESLPDAVGAFVDWLIRESGWTVEERGARAPVAARHVCLLFRRFKHFRDDATRPYQRALEARRVPHVLVGGRSFHDREEVIALRNALTAIEWPGDELSVYAALRGPLFALNDDVLLAWKAEHGTLHPLAPRKPAEPARSEPQASEVEAVADAIDVLAHLHRGRNRRPIADTVGQLLEAVRAHAALAIWPTGEQALANCLRVMDLARRFERAGASSFRAFVDRLEEDAGGGETEDAPVVEEGTEGVRIMTAHRAKGLEFPVVVLCDPTAKATRDEPSRHVDTERSLWAEPLASCAPRELLEASAVELARDRAEAVRLAYVAATRARDLLVVTAVADEEPTDTWLSALNPALYPTPRSPGEGEPAPGCPAFRGAAVAERPKNARPGDRAPVNAGRLTPRAGRHSVVWWDPKALALDAQERVGLRQQIILEADGGERAAADGERVHARWQEERDALLAAGARESCAVVPVTALAEERAREAAEVRIETVAARGARPGGRRFGALVHAVLAEVDLSADAPEVARTAELQGRIFGASAEEVAAATTAVMAALVHPVIARAAASAELRREVPVALPQDDGRLAEGVVDLAFRSAGGEWTVVDFKTDAEFGARRATYAAQVRLYADAIARATGERADPLLLVV
ncbi:MAG TPA: UvrD-helicase domain-containing protein [Myxococcota bacterium]|nr:UvrD-helicase domain-containing protein [Myxococcota bacterium]